MKKHLFHKLFQVCIFTILLLFIAVTYSQSPVPDIKINNSDGPLSLNSATDNVSLSIQLDTNGRTDAADWFIATSTPFGAFFYTLNGWTDLITPIVQTPLQPLPNIQLMNFPASALPSGKYVFYFAVDTEMDGAITAKQFYFDQIQVNLTSSPSASAYIHASKGGTLKVTNNQGDKVELEIPPRALPFSSNITLLTYDAPPTSPIADVRFPGVTILPDGLLFEEPARLRITTASVTPSEMEVFGLWAPDLAVPTGDMSVYAGLQADKRQASQSLSKRSSSGGTYQNEVFKGRTYIGGIPSKTEAKKQSGKLIEIPPLSYPNWQAAKEQIRGILIWAEVFMHQGDDAVAELILDSARDIAGKVIQDFLEVPAPANPCDEDYTTLLFELGELTMVDLSHDMPAVDQEFQQRIKTVMSFCQARYELEIEYKSTIQIQEYNVLMKAYVKGRIPISIIIDDAEWPDLGYGELSITGSGQSGDCSVSISGSGDVAVAGRLSFDDVGLPTLLLKLQHDIVQTTTMTCPRLPPKSVETDEWLIADQILEISPFNGSRITQKHDFGNYIVELMWTLHHVVK